MLTEGRGGVRLEMPGPRAYRFGVDDGVAAALAASNLSRLRGAALQRLLAGACLARVSAGSVTHREGETGSIWSWSSTASSGSSSPRRTVAA